MISRPSQKYADNRNNSRNHPEGARGTKFRDANTTGYCDEYDGPKRVFPFRQTPSGNFKVSSNQIVFETKKVSVLVSNPSYTTVNLDDEYGSTCQSITIRDGVKTKTLFGHPEKVAESSDRLTLPSFEEQDSLWEEDFEDRDSELRIVRKGFHKAARIDWQQVNIPPKTNLQHLLLQRIQQCCKPDTFVRIGSEDFYCHALVLQCYSHYFDDMEIVQLKEPIDLPEADVSGEAFNIVYSWMVTDQSAQLLSQDTILEVYMAAEYLSVDELKLQCWAFLDSEDLFAEDTAFVMLMQAKAVGNKDVMQVMIPRVMKFFLALVSSRDFLELEVAEVVMLLQSNHVCVHGEIEMFMAAVRWLTYKWSERKQYLEETMSCIRFGLIASWQLVDIRRNPENPQFIEVTQCEEVRKMVEDGLAYSIIKNWYSGIAQDYCTWITILGLTEPTPRNWVGDPIPYITYKQFVKDLQIYRHAYMADQKRCTGDGVACTGKHYDLPVLPVMADSTLSMANPFPVGPPGHEMTPPPEALAHLLARRDFVSNNYN